MSTGLRRRVPRPPTLRHRLRDGGARGDARGASTALTANKAARRRPTMRRSASATRRARRPTRTSSNAPAIANNGDLQRRPPQPHRARLPGDGLGRHHPAVRLRRRERPDADLPGLQLDAGGAGDLAERLRATPPPPTRPSPRCSIASSALGRPGSSRTSATTTRTPTTVDAAARRECLLARAADRGQPTLFDPGPHPGRVPGRVDGEHSDLVR